jgi:phage major head subunit gpT-like protein
MRVITSRQYDRLLSKQWWPNVMKTGPKSSSKKERIIWLLDTAKIKDTDKGGHIPFDDIVSQTTEVEFSNAAAGLKIKKEDLDDIDGHGVDFATHWSRQMGTYAAYWPQKKLAKAILANGKTYDGKNFFATDHPYNPFRARAGTFANVFTGAANAGTGYPGAIDLSTGTIAECLDKLSEALAYIASIKMPNGEDPRNLQVAKLIVPPRLATRAVQLTNAKYIAQLAQTGVAAGGTGDIEAVITNFGLGQPVVAPELGKGFGGDDKTCYLAMDDITSDELGAFMWMPREDFSVNYFGWTSDSYLARLRELHWYTEGRYGLLNGHPFCMFKLAPT